MVCWAWEPQPCGARRPRRVSAALPLLDDITTSPASRRLASACPALAPKCQLILARTLSRKSFASCQGFFSAGSWERTHPACRMSDTQGTLEACAPRDRPPCSLLPCLQNTDWGQLVTPLHHHSPATGTVFSCAWVGPRPMADCGGSLSGCG